MYRYFHGSERNTIPTGLPSRLVDPMLRTIGDNPQFLKIGEGNEPRNELLRKVYQQPSKDVVRTKVLGDIYPPSEKEAYLARPENIAAIRTASEQLGIPLESTGLRIATNPFRLVGDITNVDAATELIGKASSNLAKQGKPVFYNALTRKAKFFAQPTSYSELAIDGTEGIEAILEAYEKAEPRRTASSQGNRPILMQADGLDPNIGIPTGSPENIPPMDIEGMKGANRYVDVSQGLETARVIEYPNIYDRLNNGAQPTVTATIPYSSDIPTVVGDSILSPKVSIETKRPRFIDEGTGIYTRQGERINAEQQNLLDTGMADLEDRSFILRDPATARLEQLNRPKRIATVEGAMGTDSIYQNDNTQYRPSSRAGMEVLGVEMAGNTYLKGRDRLATKLEFSPVIEMKNLWGTDIPIEDPIRKNVELVRDYVLGEKKYVETRLPINRLTDDLSDRLLSGDVDLRNYEPFKSINAPQYYLDQSKEFVGPIRAVKDITYGATQGRTPWREYYSDPFMYEDKTQDREASRLLNAINNAPRQLENALELQASANRKVFDIEQQIAYVPSLNRIAKGARESNQNIAASPEAIMDWVEARKAIKPIVAPLQKERRIAEIEASKAQDQIAQLRTAQDILGVEYMVQPKLWGEDVLSGYRLGSRTVGGIRDSNEVPVNSRFTEAIDDEIKISRIASQPTMPIEMQRKAINIKPNAVEAMRFALKEEAMEDRRDYDIASLFGFSGGY